MNIGNITSDNFNLDSNGKDIQIEVYEQLIEQLQQENERLKENNMSYQEEMAKTWKITDDYKSRFEKAIEYINKNLILVSILDGVKTFGLNSYTFDYKELLQILEDKEVSE